MSNLMIRNQLGWGFSLPTASIGAIGTATTFPSGSSAPIGSSSNIFVPPAPSSSNNNTMNIFNTISNLVSQFLGSRGKYQTSQILTGPGGVTAIPQAYGQPNPYAQPAPYYGPNPGYQQPVGGGPGSTLGGGVDGVFNWLLANPMVLIVGGLGLYLLFKEPPRRR